MVGDMAKKPGRGRGRGKGTQKGTIGQGDILKSPVVEGLTESAVFDDADDNRSPFDQSEDGVETFNNLVNLVDPNNVDVDVVENFQVKDIVEEENFSVVQNVDTSLNAPILEGQSEFPEDHKAGSETLYDPKDWRGLFKVDRTMDNLQYFSPAKIGGKVCVTPPVEAVEEGINRWRSSLVGQFMDKSMPYFLVKKAVSSMWKQYGEIEVFSLDNGMFIFRFHDEVSCDEILDSKLWHISNKPLILRKWQPGMQVLKLTLTSVPVWVKFVHLPMEFWTPTCLSYVASGVGKPLYADKVTEDQKRLGFARVLVEIDINSECPKEIEICRSNGNSIIIGVEYPWLPPKCSTCGGFGHATYACANKEKKVWKPKVLQPVKGRKVFPVSPGVVSFDRVIRKPVGVSKSTGRPGTLRLSNSFEPIGRLEKEEGDVEERHKRTPVPTTFLEVFENALTSKDKGKTKMGESSGGERGFSPTKAP